RRLLQFLRLAPDEIVGSVRKIRLSALRRPSGLLFPDWPRLRMGTDAARSRPKSRLRRLEPTRLGPTYRQIPPRTSQTPRLAAAVETQYRRRPASRRRIPLQSGRCNR